ncbi:hypothetical protein ACFRAQ_21490 [Nocardia sp. NPDC056611]|uniref:hypothetical protein n=1 Tax=unclassified Nocardia TaxID=2637762 RepID=UPI00366B78A4
MNLRSLLHLESKTVPLLPADESGTDADSAESNPPGTSGRKANRALEERLERLLTPTEMDLIQHHRI